MGVHWKVQFLVGGRKNNKKGGIVSKRGTWIVCRFKRRLDEKEEDGNFEVEFIPQCTLWITLLWWVLKCIELIHRHKC